MIAAVVLGGLVILGILLTSAQTLLVWRFQRRPHRSDGAQGRGEGRVVSILKPVCGLDDELEENLLSFTRLSGVDYEVILSAEEWDDPALEVARRVLKAHPDAPFRIVVEAGSGGGVVNRKVERLIAAARVARGDLLFISDSNVRVSPDDIRRTVAAFENPRVGCVSNIFTGEGATTLGATVESLHLLSFVTPGAVMAAAAKVPCVVGKSMAITREAHDAIGGFSRFRRVLAEDQSIGLAVRNAGFDVLLSPVTVRNVVVRRDVQRAFDRQVRWNKIRFSFSRPLYCAELLLNPLALALIAAACGAGSPAAPLLLLVLLSRFVQLISLNRTLAAGMRLPQLALVPFLDLLMLAAWAVPFFSNTVTWRGYRARIGRNTEMIERLA